MSPLGVAVDAQPIKPAAAKRYKYLTDIIGLRMCQHIWESDSSDKSYHFPHHLGPSRFMICPITEPRMPPIPGEFDCAWVCACCCACCNVPLTSSGDEISPCRFFSAIAPSTAAVPTATTFAA